jgi:hypothetical protein
LRRRSVLVLRLSLAACYALVLLIQLILVLGLLLLLRNDVSTVGQIVSIIGEQIILFSVNERLNNDSSLLSLILQNIDNDIHDLGDHRGEALENLVYNALAHLLKHVVNILQQIEGGLSKFFKLRLDKIDEDID